MLLASSAAARHARQRGHRDRALEGAFVQGRQDPSRGRARVGRHRASAWHRRAVVRRQGALEGDIRLPGGVEVSACRQFWWVVFARLVAYRVARWCSRRCPREPARAASRPLARPRVAPSGHCSRSGNQGYQPCRPAHQAGERELAVVSSWNPSAPASAPLSALTLEFHPFHQATLGRCPSKSLCRAPLRPGA